MTGRVRDTQAGRDRIRAELARYRAWCERTGVPAPRLTADAIRVKKRLPPPRRPTNPAPYQPILRVVRSPTDPANEIPAC